MASKTYIHGSSEPEQDRLYRLNSLTNAAFIRFLEINSSDLILEIGSGLGILAEQLSKSLVSGKLTGIEISDDQLNKCPPSGKTLEFTKGDVQFLPFPESSFDKVYGRYILEHLPDTGKALREVMRVLKPGGEVSFQENSILLIDFYPDCPKFKDIWKKFALLQHKLGGDAMIGIKLYSLLSEAGFINIALSLAPEIHWFGKESFEPWILNLVKNIEGGSQQLENHGLATKAEIKAAIDELIEFQNNPIASTYFYWNRAKANKPKS